MSAAPSTADPTGGTPDVVANAAAEAATGADTENARECPFCVMMRQGGCEDVFKAFMECGERADNGEQDMSHCLPQFEALNKCMERNKEVFDGLLKEMSDEEQRAKQDAAAAAGGSTSTQQPKETADAAPAAGGVTTHSHAATQQPQQQQEGSSSAAASSTPQHGNTALQPAAM